MGSFVICSVTNDFILLLPLMINYFTLSFSFELFIKIIPVLPDFLMILEQNFVLCLMGSEWVKNILVNHQALNDDDSKLMI